MIFYYYTETKQGTDADTGASIDKEKAAELSAVHMEEQECSSLITSPLPLSSALGFNNSSKLPLGGKCDCR